MGSKIQGEGDYEAGRRFQEEEHEFVKRKFGKKRPKDERNLDAAAEDEMDYEDYTDLDDDEDTQIANPRELNSAADRSRNSPNTPQSRR